MKTIKQSISKTAVNKLFTTVFFLTALAMGSAGIAASEDDCNTVERLRTKLTRSQSEEADFTRAQKNCDQFRNNERKGDKQADKCENAQKAYNDAKNETDKACRDAGMGAGEKCRKALSSDACTNEIEQANRETSDSGTDSDYTTAILNAIGLGTNKPANPNQKATKATCPLVTGKSFYADRDKLKADLKDAQKELADLKKDITDEQKDYDKQYKEISKHIKDEQKAVRDKKADLDKESRDMAAKLIEQQQNLQNQMRQNELKMVDIRTKIIDSDTKLALSLSQISDTAAKRTCNKQVLDLKKQLDTSTGGGVSGLIGSGSALMKKLQAEFDNCMQGIDEQRAAVYKSNQNEKNALTKQLENASADSSDISDQINSLQNQVQQEKNAIETKKSDADKDLFDEINSSTQELAALQKTTTQKINAMNEQLMSIQQRINELNAELMAMNRQPLPPKDSTKNKDDVDTALNKEKLLKPEAQLACCNDFLPDEMARNPLCTTGKAGGIAPSVKGDR